MNRIDQKFKELRRKKRKAFLAFITAGDPSLKTTEQLALKFEKSGVDILEIGVPFSDPLADGPTIQASSQRALSHHVTLSKILTLVKSIRRKSQLPIALMAYYNPIFHYGEAKFISDAKRAGVDGVIIPDLPPEEASGLIKAGRKNQISTVFFMSPTTTKERMKRIAAASSGFIYYVSLTGVTGARKGLSLSYEKQIRLAKQLTQKPICVGFGISNAQQVKDVTRVADGAIVGSAIVQYIQKNKGKGSLVKNTGRFVASLTRGLK